MAEGQRRYVTSRSSCHLRAEAFIPCSDLKLDTDDPDHITWLYEVASARAKEFKIEGVTWSSTQGVVKNIIPAIASTNAIIAGEIDSPFFLSYSRFTHGPLFLILASCCTEALKIATTSAPYLDNYFMLIGTEGVYSYTFQHEKRPDCPVCGGASKLASIPKDFTVEQLIEWLTEKQDMYVPLCFRKLPIPSHSCPVANLRTTRQTKQAYL